MNTFSHLNTSATTSQYSIPSSPGSDALDPALQKEYEGILWHESECLDPDYGRHTSPDPHWVNIWSPKELDVDPFPRECYSFQGESPLPKHPVQTSHPDLTMLEAYSLGESSSQVLVDVGEEQDRGSAPALPPQEVLPPPEVVSESLNPTVPGFSQCYENLERPPYEDRFYANVTVAEEVPALSTIRRNLRSFPLPSGDIPTIPQPEGAFATLTTSSLSLSAGPMASENDHPFGHLSSSSVLSIQRRAGLSNFRHRPSSNPYDGNLASGLSREGEEASTSRRVLGPLPPQFVRDVPHSRTSRPFVCPTASSSLQAAEYQQDLLNSSPTGDPTFQTDAPDSTTPPFPFSPEREQFGPLSEDSNPKSSSTETDTHGPFAVTPFAGSSSNTSRRDKSQKSSVIYKLVQVASLSEQQLGTFNATQSTLPPGFALVEEATRQVVNELFRAEEDEMFFSTHECLLDGTITRRLGWYWCRWPGCSQHFYAKGEIKKHKTIHTKASDRLYSCKNLTPPCPCPRDRSYSDERSAKRHAKLERAKWEKENNN